VVSVQRFSDLQADAFGQIAQGLGNQVVQSTFPKPDSVSFHLDSSAGVELLRNQFLDFIDASANVVIKQFTNAQTWMNESNEFGEAWAKFGGADPKAKIRLHFDDLRKDWAKQWTFFGTAPLPIATPILTDTIERALWAGHVARLFSDPRFTNEPDTMTVAEGFADAVGGKVLENAVVNRLKSLNVVKAETQGGFIAQWVRQADQTIQAPRPSVKIDDEVDTRTEVDRLRAWAEDYLNSLDKEVQTRFFPPARPRAVQPIQYT